MCQILNIFYCLTLGAYSVKLSEFKNVKRKKQKKFCWALVRHTRQRVLTFKTQNYVYKYHKRNAR